jgi:hypothetical protein
MIQDELAELGEIPGAQAQSAVTEHIAIRKPHP